MSQIKESLTFTDFLKENQNRVPAEIIFKKSNSDFLFFQQVFANLEVIGIHLIKKAEWFYGIYSGCKKVGFIYDGDTITPEQQQKCFQEYLPEDANDLIDYVNKYNGKINFHKCSNEAYKIIGELNEKEIIQKLKRK